jgi:hypothetical protein
MTVWNGDNIHDHPGYSDYMKECRLNREKIALEQGLTYEEYSEKEYKFWSENAREMDSESNQT